MISTFAGTFISTDRENDTSRSALTNRPALAYTHTEDEPRAEGVKWRMGKDEEDGEKRMELQKRGRGEVIEEDVKLRMEMDEGEELAAGEQLNDPAFDTFFEITFTLFPALFTQFRRLITF